MKQGWTYKKLGEVAKIQNGYAFDSKMFNNISKGTPLIRIRDIKRAYTNTYTTESCNDDFVVEDGDLLIGMDGDFNVCSWAGGHAYLNQRVCRVIPSDKISVRFLYYLIPYPLKQINDKTSFSTVKHLSSKQVTQIVIPVPPLSEQKCIVKRLDSAFAHIDELKANAEKQLSEARALFQKALSKAMEPKEGWEEKTLGEVCDTFNGLWKGKKPPFVNVGVIRNANFTKDFTLRYDNIEYLDVEEKQYSKRKLQPGDLIIEKSGGSEKQPVGRAVLFEKEDGEFSFSNFTSVLRIKDNVLLSRFLYIYLLYIYKRGDTLTMQKATTGIHNIEFEKYLNIGIPCIPLSEQQRIVARLDSLSENVKKLEEIQRKIIAECDALKQALLRKVFE